MHEEKCSKVQTRGSDIGAVFSAEDEPAEDQPLLSESAVKTASPATPGLDVGDALVLVNENVLQEVLSPHRLKRERDEEIVYTDDDLEVSYLAATTTTVSDTKRPERIGTGTRCAQFKFFDMVIKEILHI